MSGVCFYKYFLNFYFLQPISECEVSIGELIDKIQTDRWPVPQGTRPLRAIGAALSVAITLLEVILN